MDKIMDKFYLSNSGNPLSDISSDVTAASADCANVFTARTPAVLPHSIQSLFFIVIPPF